MKKLFLLTGLLWSINVGFADSLTREFSQTNAAQGGINARAFSLHDVRLLDSPFKDAMQRDSQWLLSLEPDRFLAWFRKEAGLDAKGEVYGGWESKGVAGQNLGHYISACAMMYAATGDERFKQRVDYIIDELAMCQEKNGNGYVGAIPEGKRIFSEIASGDVRSAGFDLNGGWVPWYTQHKMMAGLRDAFAYGQNAKAFYVLIRLADWVIDTTKKLDEDQWQKMLACEHGGMMEVCADVYALTGDAKYLQLAKNFYDRKVLEPLAREKDILAGLHANTQVPKVIGAARIYELTQEQKFRTISVFFWDTVVNHHTFVNGGNSSNEHFGQPDKLSELMHDTTETCNTYNMLKLTRHLFAWYSDSRYMDYYERAVYNHILAHQHPVTGMLMYKGFLDMPSQKHFCTPTDSFWCCVGTGMENHAKYGDSIYFHDEQVLYVNLFIPSVLKWKDKGITITQKTCFPQDDKAVICIDMDESQYFSLRIRVPAWCQNMSIQINGERISKKPDEMGYVELNRTYSNGDVVELQLPMTLRTEGLVDKPNRIAFLYGPIVLAAELSDNKLPVLVGDTESFCKAIQMSEPLVFSADNIGYVEKDSRWEKQSVRWIPLYMIADQKYTVYMDTITQLQQN